MLSCELLGHIQFIIDMAFIKKIKLSISHHIYSNNVHLKHIRFTVL